MGKQWMALLAVVICGSAGCAESTLTEWPKECVGRLQLALPGEADLAAYLFKDMFKNPAQYSGPYMRFPDGERADWTEFSGGKIEMSHPLTKEEKIDAWTELKKVRTKVINGYKKRENIDVRDWPIGQQEGMGWIAPGQRITLNLFAGDALFSWYRDAKNDAQFSSVQAEAQNIVNGLRPRTLFNVPSEPGLCLPYVFIPDSGQEEHAIAMSYRLKEHPDIVISLIGNTAESTPKKGEWRRPEVVTNEYRTDTYWDGRLGAGAGLSTLKTHWRFPSMRPTQLTGRSGLESFVAVVRVKETEEDHIYHAVARGDPDNPEAAPDVRLIVEQTRQNAVKRGIKPLTQDEVLKLARQIAASVTVRPVR